MSSWHTELGHQASDLASPEDCLAWGACQRTIASVNDVLIHTGERAKIVLRLEEAFP